MNGMQSMLPCLKRRAWIAAVLLAAVLGGCGSSYPPAPAIASTVDRPYIIGPGDQLNVVVWRNPDLSSTIPVRPDGRITVPLVENMQAAGKDPSTLARDIEQALSKFIRDPVVSVVTVGFVGEYSEQIRVVGQATKPQVLPFRHNMSVLDVMIAVGGLTDTADGNGATILRTAEGNKVYSVRLRDLMKKGDVSANVQMLPGDVLIIPQSLF